MAHNNTFIFWPAFLSWEPPWQMHVPPSAAPWSGPWVHSHYSVDSLMWISTPRAAPRPVLAAHSSARVSLCMITTPESMGVWVSESLPARPAVLSQGQRWSVEPACPSAVLSAPTLQDALLRDHLEPQLEFRWWKVCEIWVRASQSVVFVLLASFWTLCVQHPVNSLYSSYFIPPEVLFKWFFKATPLILWPKQLMDKSYFGSSIQHLTRYSLSSVTWRIWLEGFPTFQILWATFIYMMKIAQSNSKISCKIKIWKE